ncbi:polymorphic toxin-type HINT domain-containing protein [Xanthomonas campestris pv. plantaginis]|uniref:polymorphic toxin-type HINT domain-containing protein n=1 Tax=Xanthomonas campestris TaxID=339 RepID=UPI002B223EAF|nr:polymorphic toxin-type HINT domain-containing protein [Xanthomonas campestris]MEA9606616.1 polymorphic toxin-type HINT domain-containing protein [Xanthomonas campestris pv. plantaginis]
MDMMTRTVVYTFSLDSLASGTISSVAVSGNWLYISLRSDSTNTVGGGLFRVNINPLARGFMAEQQQLIAPQGLPVGGYQDLAINNDSYLGLTSVSGTVTVFDLNAVSRDGIVDADGVRTFGAEAYSVSNRGKTPTYITAGLSDGQFLVSNMGDKDTGLGVIDIRMNGDGQVRVDSDVNAQALLMRGPVDFKANQKAYRQDILTAAGAVIVTYGGVQYALVADKNYWFNDPVATTNPGSLPTAQIGGKIGVIRNPFGLNGKPAQYLGATTPIAGSAIDKLSIGADGILYAGVWNYETNYNMFAPMTYSMYTWDAASLVQAALTANSDAIQGMLRGRGIDPATMPIDRDYNLGSQNGIGQLIPEVTPRRYEGPTADQGFGWIHGMASYNVSGIPVNLDAALVPPGAITVSDDNTAPVTPLSYKEFLDPNDTLVGGILYKGMDLIFTGGYMERYDDRLKQLNHGELTYDQLVSANFVDYMATALATRVSMSAAGKVTGWVHNAGFNKIIAGLAGGAAAGATFEAILEAGLKEIYQLTNGKAGSKEISLTQILLSGAVGAIIGGAGGALFVGIGKLVGRGSDPVQGKIGQNDPNASPADTIDMNSPNSNSGTGTIVDNTLPYIRPGSKAIVAGKVAFTAPKAGSLVLGDASTWFSQQIARLPEMIDTSLPVAAQFEQAYQLRQMLRASGANSLVDSTLRGEFLEEFVLASRENIRAKFAEKFSGDALYRKMLDEVLTKVDDTIASETSCFIAGTTVWTEVGEVAIESIKPGDRVLSRPEEGGELAYRSVVRTIQHRNKVIVGIFYVDPNRPQATIPTFATEDHPFWVEGRGWVAAGALRPGYKLQATDGRKLRVSMVSPVHRTETPGVGWCQLTRNNPDLGDDFDFNGPSLRLVKSNTYRPNKEFVEGPLLGVDVYNLEVDGFHTYYVGKAGVWVHNANCNFRLMNEGNGALPPKGTTAFASEAELNSQLTDGQTGFTLVRSVTQTYAEKLGDERLFPWIVFEDGVVGRVVSEGGIRYEYAVLFKKCRWRPDEQLHQGRRAGGRRRKQRVGRSQTSLPRHPHRSRKARRTRYLLARLAGDETKSGRQVRLRDTESDQRKTSRSPDRRHSERKTTVH